jgi:murein L,D-transpeptidase YcbB/YkuD
MGGRPLDARFGVTGGAFLLAVLAALAAAMWDAKAQNEPAALAAADPATPAAPPGETALDPAADLAGRSEIFSEPAADEEEPLSPAAEPLADPGRGPADEGTIVETPSQDAVPSGTAATPSAPEEKPSETAAPAPSESESAPAGNASAPAPEPVPAVAEEAPPPDPIVAEIRLKLKDAELRKGAAPEDFAALEAFYGERGEPPLWITAMGFNAKGQSLIAEIQKADDWGLAADAFDLPPASHLPGTTEAQAVDEIKLSLAILKYARFARGGRVSPARISPLFDQASNLLDPKQVLNEIAATETPAAYLVSLHPKQEQFEQLRKLLAKAVAAAKAKGRKPAADGNVQRIVVNMERWRWVPRDLGTYYVWNNIPAFTTRVMKDGKSIYIEKAIVGQVKYATPIFSADMRSIVFNPEWIVPETIKIEDLQPRLRQTGKGGLPDVSVLRDNKLSVSYQGKPIDAQAVDWGRANILAYTFTQPPGPDNVLGVLKFNFPNRHSIYMHDTVQRDLFKENVRTLSHGCIRLNQPERLAALLLAEDKGWPADQVKGLLEKGSNSGVVLSKPVPVHLTYFTMAADGIGRMQTYADVYGIDVKMAQALFGRSDLLSADATPQEPKQKRRAENGRPSSSFLPGLFGN